MSEATEMNMARAPKFEGLALEMTAPAAPDEVRRLVDAALGPGWEVTPLPGEPCDFDVNATAALTPAAAWEATYRLRAAPGVHYAEPLFELAVSNRPDWGGASGATAA